MKRRTVVLIAAICALLSAALFSALPARASHPHAVDPAQIDPTTLQLPTSALPPNARLDHSAVSDNADAYGVTTPADGFKSQLTLIHQKSYAQLGRITGYRMDFSYQISGVPAGTEYLASIYPSADLAQAAMNDATGPGSLITIIGTPLPACTVGDACVAYSGPVPGSANTAVLAVFRDGPIVVETATQVPGAQFTGLASTLESALYALLKAADIQVRAALNGTPPPPPTTDTPTPSPTATPTATPTDSPTIAPTPTNTAVPVKKSCPKNSSKKHGKCVCKKGYTKKHGKCVKKKH